MVCAFTATATKEVKEDVQCILKLQNPKVITTGFERKNLYYEVRRTKHKDRKNVKLLSYRLDENLYYGALQEGSEIRIKEIINHLLTEGYLYQTSDKYMLLKFAKSVDEILKDEKTIILRCSRGMGETVQEEKKKALPIRKQLCLKFLQVEVWNCFLN